MKLYVDGELLEENTSASLLANSDKPLYIGAGRTNKHPHDEDPPNFILMEILMRLQFGVQHFLQLK